MGGLLFRSIVAFNLIMLNIVNSIRFPGGYASPNSCLMRSFCLIGIDV